MDALESKVLVVEPNKTLQRELRKALPDVDLRFVATGKAAVVELKKHPPELVVMDIMMSEVDGFAILKALNRRQSLADLPVVWISSGEDEEEPDSTVVVRGDFATLRSRVRNLIANQERRRSFNESYARVLFDAARGASDLTAEERKVLERAGFPLDRELTSTPLAVRAAKYDTLITSSLTTEQAAKRLGVNTSRIRQRLLTPPQLYGIRRGNTWCLPLFQFTSKGLVHGIDKVIARLDPNLDPVAVETWFTTPNLDLETDSLTLSPLDWLKTGYSVETVQQLADEV